MTHTDRTPVTPSPEGGGRGAPVSRWRVVADGVEVYSGDSAGDALVAYAANERAELWLNNRRLPRHLAGDQPTLNW